MYRTLGRRKRLVSDDFVSTKLSAYGAAWPWRSADSERAVRSWAAYVRIASRQCHTQYFRKREALETRPKQTRPSTQTRVLYNMWCVIGFWYLVCVCVCGNVITRGLLEFGRRTRLQALVWLLFFSSTAKWLVYRYYIDCFPPVGIFRFAATFSSLCYSSNS